MVRPVLSDESALEYSESIGQVVGGTLAQLAWARKNEVHRSLGMEWDAWVRKYVGGQVRLPIDERRQAALELTEGEGLSNVAAADVLGVDEGTVRNDLRALSEDSETATVALSEDSEIGDQGPQLAPQGPSGVVDLDNDERPAPYDPVLEVSASVQRVMQLPRQGSWPASIDTTLLDADAVATISEAIESWTHWCVEWKAALAVASQPRRVK